jgi:hypothetical protein
MNGNIEEPLRAAITLIKEVLDTASSDKTAWLLIEALEHIQDALDES